ncbi:U32 family peptidase [Motiliproteus sp. SC1-56]|uniref:U32 family peptidase n=1 Tax=Motiliproteus sp. SC1-56 TaxID=2799565 RepID=UPI001A8FF10D|nr:U32 family peptidase [Motiliproteus sp. SC1-56]
MNIVAPLSKLEEILPLAAAGADEFYCSVVPGAWMKRFGTSAVSRRAFSNLSQEADLEAAVTQCRALGKRISLVMNAQHYTAEQLDCLLELARAFDRLGGDAVIVGDPVLLGCIGSEGFGFGLHLSSIASCRNAETARFYQELGATRVIFPRDMTLKEIGRLTKAVPDLEYEAFVLNDGCVFEEGVCHSIHLPRNLGGAICMDRYSYTYARMDRADLSPSETEALAHNDQRYLKWLWYRFGCGFSVTDAGYPFGPCGLCALPALREAGVTAVKIAGRDAPLTRKEKSVELVRRTLDRMAADRDPARLMDYAQALRPSERQCASGYMCYYPEVLRQRASRVIARTG